MNRRLLSLVVPPVVALVAATFYMQYRLRSAEQEIAAFCATVMPGMSARTFIERALAAGLEARDFGADSSSVVASTMVYSWRREFFECRAERDTAGRIRSSHTARHAE